MKFLAKILIIISLIFGTVYSIQEVQPLISGLISDYTVHNVDCPYEECNKNNPYFTDDETCLSEPFIQLSDLDHLDRCGAAFALLGPETLPHDERPDISMVYPTGWKQSAIESIDGGYLYNRCHLIGWQLSGIGADDRGLITGTRYFNMEGMLPFENMVADYIRETGHHVLYRVTPKFEGDELLCRGILMEALSVEDDEIRFCVYVPNVQPGVTLDYQTGNNFYFG